jgi:hypothetical protein
MPKTELTGIVTPDIGLWLRDEPNGSIICGMPKGARVIVHDAADGWLRVTYPAAGYCGYAFAQYIEIEHSKPAPAPQPAPIPAPPRRDPPMLQDDDLGKTMITFVLCLLIVGLMIALISWAAGPGY